MLHLVSAQVTRVIRGRPETKMDFRLVDAENEHIAGEKFRERVETEFVHFDCTGVRVEGEIEAHPMIY